MKGEEEYPDLNRDCNFNYSSNQMFQCLHRQIQEGHLGMSVCVRKKNGVLRLFTGKYYHV